MTVFSSSQIEEQTESWKILATTAKSQLAVMILEEGEVSGSYGTDHPQADQVLYCVNGAGEVESEGETIKFSAGDAVLIPAGDKHQVRGGPCTTINFYGPPAYPNG
ncbi:MAG TPA: cupin domain-containing protein [Fimbriimonas sp.]|nr:cupin domain-containing protein [Fimbriimonas sp.]